MHLWRGLDRLAPVGKRGKLGRPLALALRLLLVTAQRRGELAAAKWEHFADHAAEVPGADGKPVPVTFRVWTSPTNKSDRPHAIPLSPLACDLLDELKALAGESEYVLPSVTTGGANTERDRSITRAARTVRRELAMDDWRPHDLRRTARTGMARLGVADAVAERVLNHAAGDRMVAVYNRHGYLLEMRDAVNVWADRVATLVARAPK